MIAMFPSIVVARRN